MEEKNSKSWKIWAIPVFILLVTGVTFFIKYMDYKSSRDSLSDALKALEVEDAQEAYRNFHNSTIYDDECGECYYEWAKFNYYDDFPEGAKQKMLKAIMFLDEEDKTDAVYELAGKASYYNDDMDDAQEYFSQMKADSDSSSLYKSLILKAKGDIKEAKKQLETFINEKGENKLVLYELAEISLELNEYEKAEDYCDRVLGLNPELGDAYYLKSKALFFNDDTTGAGCKALNIALDMDVKDDDHLTIEYCKDVQFTFTY